MKPLIDSLIKDFRIRFDENIVSIFGIGSFFDKTLPGDWIKKDIDIVVILNSVETLPKKDWTTAKFEKRQSDGFNIWIGYNSLRSLLNKDLFSRESFSNYAWSILDLKYPQNSVLLYGKDIRSDLPKRSDLQFEFDDILKRSLYHLDQSYRAEYREKNMEISKHALTKAVFKFCFYLSVFFEQNFTSTSIRTIAKQLNRFVKEGIIKKKILEILRECILYRRTNQFRIEFHTLRMDFMQYLISNLGEGTFHARMNYPTLIEYLENSYRGLEYIIKLLKKANLKNNV
ncbi:MAG: hypothetical protein BAJALOKI3v1_460002 [Promethearchaeota archaeon]|nr:MAG: hypothetical protein BAJALOKI3v1_460002 [Candidatus Lokiarchaeota archaeon]